MEKRFSVEEMLEYKKLKRRQGQLALWAIKLGEDMDKLIKQQQHHKQESDELEAKLAGEFSELEEASTLFNWSDVPDQNLSLEDRNYVTNEKKQLIIKSLLQKFQRANPDVDRIPFKTLHKMLEQDFQVETRSITNFFKNQLPEYELVGGTRNRSVVLGSGGAK